MIAVKKVYRFNCPNCQSRLEGESKEFEDIGGKISKFFCPVCKKDRYITWSDLGRRRCMRVRIRNNYNSLYERRVTTMSNLKNVIIYLLSVLIAFESGVLLFIIGMFTVTNDLKNEQRNRRVSYTSYRNKD